MTSTCPTEFEPAVTRWRATPIVTGPMEWTHSETIGLANVKCSKCKGTGLVRGSHRDGKSPCNCVWRQIFRACLRQFYSCEHESVTAISKAKCVPSPGSDSSSTWSRFGEDFQADFYLIARRTLSPDEVQVFRLHFLLGGDWRQCCERLKIDRDTFFHAVYRIEAKLGRAYREVRPYSLYPTDEYFGGIMRRAKVLVMPATAVESKAIVRPPLRRVA